MYRANFDLGEITLKAFQLQEKSFPLEINGMYFQLLLRLLEFMFMFT